ncbi:MAG: alpha/beta fold hydrolase [Acidobacteria bacterium]|nr:alpha/beta fold hydrolase [Acidobacteriota bacterium]
MEPNAEVVEESLGAAEAMLSSVDPLALGRSLRGAVIGAAKHPVPAVGNLTRFASNLARAAAASAQRSVGIDATGPLAPAANDKRFRDPAWSENAGYYGMLQAYLAAQRLVLDTVDIAELEEPSASKARFAAQLIADALAPTNFLATNPAALRRAFETGGRSVVRGVANFVHDVRTNGGYPNQVDLRSFEVGRNLAVTAGKVVFRNELIELIQYEPVTEQVYEIPLLFCPPWVNKYYILDLAPGKSLIEWCVRNGFTVFVISYRNPDASMRDVGFDDYMLQGPRAALDVVRDITGAEIVNTVAACIGGTLNTALLAYLDAVDDRGIVNSSTYLNCLNDHSIGGTLGTVFSDDRSVEGLSRRMAKHGYLEAGQMARTFNLMRANDLIFNYVASGWLMGDRPPAFDLLAWNSDSTRMPAKMHSFYLRKCWVENALARDEVELAGQRLMVSEISTETYVCAAIDDHIVPWRGSYKTTQLFKGECRFVLTSAGHIAGIVNPPNPKSRLWTNDELPVDPDAWFAGATEHRETWWNDWLAWISDRSGSLSVHPPLGNDRYPALCDAPGEYVRA